VHAVERGEEVGGILIIPNNVLSNSPHIQKTDLKHPRPSHLRHTLGPRDWRMVAVVAEPEAKVKACAPSDSREARRDSRAARFGLSERA